VRWISSRPDAARLTTVKTYQLVKQTLTSQFALHHAWVVYDALHECGEKRVRLSNKELASRVGLGRSTVAKVMTVLEQLGCIATRYPDGVDNRARVIMVPRTLSGLAVARLHGIVDGTVSVDWSAARLVCQVKELAEVLGATLVHAEFGADEPEFLLFDAADSSTEPPLGDEASAGGASLRGVGGCSFLECFETNDHCSMLRDAITSTATDAKALTEDNAIALIQRASIQEEEQALTRELSGPELEVLTHELHEASGVKRGVTLADQRLVSEALKRFTPQELLAAGPLASRAGTSSVLVAAPTRTFASFSPTPTSSRAYSPATRSIPWAALSSEIAKSSSRRSSRGGGALCSMGQNTPLPKSNSTA
jgi:DNA-binding MarR family transcriptional regulator